METGTLWRQPDLEPCSTDQDNEPEIIRIAFKTDELEVKAPISGPRPRQHSDNDGDRTFRLCLREIGQVKPLTPQEEIELVARIKRGDQKARERMIKANLRRVVKISREYENIGLPLLDLISEGSVGLLKAVERFDPSSGSRLSTDSNWWIKQSIKRALAARSNTISLAKANRSVRPRVGPAANCEVYEEGA